VSGDLSVKTVDFSGRPFHFIGVGGIGMSALAYILAQRQLPVSGSDVRPNHITKRLQAVGTYIFDRQEATNLEFFNLPDRNPEPALSILAGKAAGTSIQGAKNASQPLSQTDIKNILPQVVCSTAIATSNCEYLAAKEQGCPIFHRSDVLAALIDQYDSIAVAGTHGKTTTSSLMGYVLLEAKLDPTIIVGGEVDAWGGNARLGQGNYLVAEADESDGSLVKHTPKIGVITNIELDHPDRYQDLEEVVEVFKVFAAQCETIIGCIDCETVRERLKPQITYSLDPEQKADYSATEIECHPHGSTAQVWERGQRLGQMQLLVPGRHNISNALSVVAVGRMLGLEFEVIARAIAAFAGAKRRFELRGRSNNITFIDDYAHHPSEIRATLSAARQKVGENKNSRVVAIFQPHRYSRTATLMEEFATAFSDADLVVITDIYSAGEVNVHKINGQQVADAIAQQGERVLYHPDLKTLSEQLKKLLLPGDLTLFLGAGNLNQIIPDLLARYDAAA
jgi:UDP-N-acetylmuramate--alanine ligase